MVQLDVKTAFLYGESQKEIYLKQPERFVLAGKEKEVCKLNKCIYDLKQASRVWNQHFNQFLRDVGLNVSVSDPCVYFRRHGFTIMTISVENGLTCSNKKESASNIMKYLNNHFEMRSGPVEYFAGLKISHDQSKRRVYLSQPDYITKVIHSFNMVNCQPTSLPADHLTAKKTPSHDGNHPSDETFPYHEALGSLIYLSVNSRPDISFSVNQKEKHCEYPNKSHWAAVKLIIFTSKLPYTLD